MSSLIFKQMPLVMAEIGPVSKDQKNAAQGFKYRGIDQFVNALQPALVKHKVFITPRVTSRTEELREVERNSGKKGVDKYVSLMVEYDFFAEDGSKVTVGPIASEGIDSGDKATNKALSSALKYALIQVFSIPTEDMVDGDKESPTVSSAQAPTATAAPQTTATTEARPKVSFNKKNVEAATAKPAASGDDL